MSKAIPNIAVLVGSLRKDSYNRKLAGAIERLVGDRARFNLVRIDDLPLYNQDYDSDYPAVYKRLKSDIEGADAVLFVSPETNRSIPGVLKNAIDAASRPWGTNSFAGKPGAVLGISIGTIGTALMQQHLRNSAVFLDMHLLAQPEVFLQWHDGLIDDAGQVTNESMRDFLAGFVDKYLAWIDRFMA